MNECGHCGRPATEGTLGLGMHCSEWCKRELRRKAWDAMRCDVCGKRPDYLKGGPLPGIYIGDRWAVACDHTHREEIRACALRNNIQPA